ncbi:hypothetical protein ACQCX2_12350 [Propionibacteriaceae bacterium Y1700]|uniref:hypothetical protein n=1 Tax=Microlunatus sp. Y1700 TaxID=3418487 RepID=UPI003DA6EFBB
MLINKRIAAILIGSMLVILASPANFASAQDGSAWGDKDGGANVLDSVTTPDDGGGETPSDPKKTQGSGETPQQKRDRLIAKREKMEAEHAAAVKKWNALAAAHQSCSGRTTQVPGSSQRMYADGETTTCGTLPAPPADPNYPDIPGLSNYVNNLAIPPSAYAYMAAARLQLPEPVIQIGPDLSNIKGNMAVVGHPYWLWATGTDSMNTSASSGPLTVTLRAEAASVSFTTTDGQKISCPGAGTPFQQSVRPGTPSPDCGIKFAKRGEQRVVATVQWQIHWTAAGQAGTFTMQRTALRDIRVGELHALNTKDNPR